MNLRAKRWIAGTDSDKEYERQVAHFVELWWNQGHLHIYRDFIQGCRDRANLPEAQEHFDYVLSVIDAKENK